MTDTVITIEVDTDVADVVAKDMRRKGGKFFSLYRGRIRKLAEQTVAELAQPAPPVRYPIQWKTERQRRAFFATNGFGRGIPTQRTGALGRGWKYILTGDVREGLFTVYNDATSRSVLTGELVFYEKFVQGIYQQPFHKNTGWRLSQDILADALVKAEDLLINTWYEVNREK